MGEVELIPYNHKIIIHSVLFFYGDAASNNLSEQIAKDVTNHWNEARGKIVVEKKIYDVWFDIIGIHAPLLTPLNVFENIDPRNNYFRIEEYANGNISFVDGINCNTGYFKLDNLLDNSTTAAHEYGHTIGLRHPKEMDIRGKGVPGIMYPRGTIVDPMYQYSPTAAPLAPGGTINPFTRKVLQEDIDNLRLNRLSFNKSGFAVIGDFTSVWHDRHQP